MLFEVQVFLDIISVHVSFFFLLEGDILIPHLRLLTPTSTYLEKSKLLDVLKLESAACLPRFLFSIPIVCIVFRAKIKHLHISFKRKHFDF